MRLTGATGDHPIWGWQFCRHHLVEHTLAWCDVCFVRWLAWTPWICDWYRLLGAQIGTGTSLGRIELSGGFDMLRIGQSAYFDDSVRLAATGLSSDGRTLHERPVEVGDHAHVLEWAVVLPGAAVPAATTVGASSGRILSTEPWCQVCGKWWAPTPHSQPLLGCYTRLTAQAEQSRC